MHLDGLLKIARETIAATRYCVAATAARGAAGIANARVVQTSAPSDDWSLFFVTNASSRKACEIAAHGRLTLAYQHDPEGACVVLLGAARIDTTEAGKAAAWTGDLERWFPNGPGDPDFAVVRFDADTIELWSDAHGVMTKPGAAAVVLGRAVGEERGWRLLQA